ncbi:hypothetical protein D9756_011300 [Leucocoprinus leucothites]|uniref:Uncharacterized protein n=1 Tax=Leucocoprinus leucothites TaxID=201217 RepID=A0A8H5FQ41_9AGAR|nr:hypothetical protein D9756_011300 [Leucoagaricus leucothites]
MSSTGNCPPPLFLFHFHHSSAPGIAFSRTLQGREAAKTADAIRWLINFLQTLVTARIEGTAASHKLAVLAVDAAELLVYAAARFYETVTERYEHLYGQGCPLGDVALPDPPPLSVRTILAGCEVASIWCHVKMLYQDRAKYTDSSWHPEERFRAGLRHSWDISFVNGVHRYLASDTPLLEADITLLTSV